AYLKPLHLSLDPQLTLQITESHEMIMKEEPGVNTALKIIIVAGALTLAITLEFAPKLT
ncbi:Bgt-20255-2, partial [Blumeria graminis f. sp. tritici]